ncbi:sarcosine dehydrogenase, putative [Ixodes scapularis]|uniref:Sarcosine dehydrogenase, putative n=1 Tax=Ixodes scapularis TaxID=6945 RepID=B7Q6U9_IXOSC|nr:sarcosine dehydrogenase, putative [Ixodes scapularis]|eukprot:XP_002403418.1 sarcosine dehydrogenase, putative [Ixodes scapularis]
MNGGGGCGRELAAWVLQGRPNLDMYAYDIRRCPSLGVSSKSAWAGSVQGGLHRMGLLL